ncbi:hypothetical protein TthAK1_09300 [Thermus thermophilus]|uniref:AAA family ATPase n=1 Tax=Thermus thermophilus TaxID=274 RepID=UPI001C751A77|nr:AAA family ATPase [Thermus thermophilus]BCZ94313.1 hypothetical protein TthAK1_09300 [Thermus thermophilus]
MFRVIPAHQLPPRLEVSWLWEGMVAQGTLALLGGPGGVGKSTLVAALEVAVAAGVPFLEREVAQGEVLHLDYDTDARLQGPWYARVAAGLGVNGEALGRIRYLEPENPTRGLGEEGLKALLEMARQGPALLVLDSWSALFPFVDARRSDHVAEVMGYLKGIAKAGPAVLLLDHTPKPVQGITALERGVAGSFYKLAGARSAFLLTRVAPKLTGGRDVLKLDTLKNNLAPLEDPLGIERIWKGDALAFALTDLPEEEARPSKAERAKRAVLELLEEGPKPRKGLIRLVAERVNAGERTTEEALRALVQAGAVERLTLGGQGGAVAYRLKAPSEPAGLPQTPLRDSAALRKTDSCDEEGQRFSANGLAENRGFAENPLSPEGGLEEGWTWL